MAEEQLAEGQEKTEAPLEGQAKTEASPSQPQSIDGKGFLKETGFKSYDEAYKSLKEGQATITKKSQREKELEQELHDANEAIVNLSAQPAPDETGQADKQTNEDFFDNPEAAIDRRLEQKLAQKMKQQQMQLDVAEVRGENPEVFDILSRGGFINEAFNKNPTLNYKGKAGLKKAVEEAKISMRRYSQTMSSIVGTGSETDATAPPANETEEQMRQRIIEEESAARAASIPIGGSARGVDKERDAEIDRVAKEENPEQLAKLLLDGMV